MKKLVLIDGHSILNRAFYGVPELSNSQGLHTNAIYGFLNIMFKILDEEAADYIAVAFDLSAPTFRHKAYAEYKGTRKSMPDELREQVPLIKDVLSSMNIPILTKEGYEADDIIGTIAKRYQSDEVFVSVISGDRDLLQLSDKHIKIRIPKTSKGVTTIHDYLPEDVMDEYGVTPKEFIDVKALMGDTSDNVPGVPSIGEKTATKIIQEYHSIENAIEHVDELKPPRASKALSEHIEDAKFSKMLVTIVTDAPIETDISDMEVGNLYTKESLEWINKLEFKSFLKRYENVETEASIELDTSVIDKQDAWESLYTKLKEAKEFGISVCLEETAVKSYHENSLYAISVTLENKSYIIKDMENISDILEEIIRLDARKYILSLKPLIKLVKDMKAAKNFYDISVAAYLINPLKDSYFVEDIARDYMESACSSKSEMIGKAKLDEVLRFNDEKAINYFATESYVALHSEENILAKLKDLELTELYENVEMPLIYSLAKMENTGVRVDEERLKKYADTLLEKIAKLEESITRKAGESFNINSPKQLGEILFEKLKLSGGKKTKTGYSTAADVLEKLAPEHEIIRDILEYRQLTKLNSTYATGLAGYIREDGRIHGTFNQTITATGRISSTDPNLQNIPVRTEMGSKIRDIFVPKEGYVFVDADYSQIELRVLASLSGDEKLIESYRSAADIHAATAAQVFHVPLDEVTPELRRNAKAVNFGVVYGISAFGLSEDLSISRKEALDYINNYFKIYGGVKKFLDKQVADAKEKGYVKTMFGRIRPIPEIKSSNFMTRSFGDRVAMNSPIQGSAADIMKISMLKVDEALEKSGFDARIVLQIHDELLVEVKEDEAAKVSELVEKAMKEAVSLKVPLEVDAHIGKTWLEAK
ncbi:DNA polymerase I [Lachnoanaerobaculum gingivalis]|jgi:DNA-directed DNA polymerase|uniref:DNA polymerase I n=1 Tax=Lachnoanaerobaculum gingivalis TaxID=2490855 RepID=UPI0024A61586|nr:DNA polymerase I [Lachnoanaerobaculum gingivalis]WHE86508.1 DNA polymerase I [Lachnoanaerobaculum gingivalis]